MDSSRNVVMSIGLERLYSDMVKAALEVYGWSVLDQPQATLLQDYPPEIVLVAGSGPAQAVIERLREVREQYPSSKVVLLGPGGTDTDLVRFIEEGASGYVLLSEGIGNLLDALQMVRCNRTPSSGRITQLVFSEIRRLSNDTGTLPGSRLTSREQEIFRLIQDGLSNKEIASHLQIAPNTVKNHVHHLLEKLKVRNRHEAAWLRGRPSRAVPPDACTGTGE
jgi:DNA-binding NarL/FixJ family response regulator